jgi:hypothetical protein
MPSLAFPSINKVCVMFPQRPAIAAFQIHLFAVSKLSSCQNCTAVSPIRILGLTAAWDAKPVPRSVVPSDGNFSKQRATTPNVDKAQACNKVVSRREDIFFLAINPLARHHRISAHAIFEPAYQARVRAIAPEMICIVRPATHPSIITAVQKMRGFS